MGVGFRLLIVRVWALYPYWQQRLCRQVSAGARCHWSSMDCSVLARACCLGPSMANAYVHMQPSLCATSVILPVYALQSRVHGYPCAHVLSGGQRRMHRMSPANIHTCLPFPPTTSAHVVSAAMPRAAGCKLILPPNRTQTRSVESTTHGCNPFPSLHHAGWCDVAR